jgi:predicted O-methyltransferase YrrM
VGAALDLVRTSPITVRAQMTAALLRLAAKREPTTRPLRRALRTLLLGRVPKPERDWAATIEALRARLAATSAVTGESFDPGTHGPLGRFTMDRQPSTVGIASQFMSLPPTSCLLLMRLIRESAPRSCLELGTAFGVSAAYLGAALELNGAGKLVTLEGSEEWARLARESLDSLGLDRVEVVVGPIAATLPGALARGEPLDFVFIDAEHQAAATLEQFETILPVLAPGAVVACDDVDWPEMRAAQAAIAGNERVASSISFGRLGISIIADAHPPRP